METPATEVVASPVVAPPPQPEQVAVAIPAPVVVDSPSEAPVPLTVAPEAGTAADPEGKRMKRKYTKRAVKKAATKEKKAKKMKARKVKAKSKTTKTERKMKRVAGTKAQGQVRKGSMRFLKGLAKESDTTVGTLVGKAVEEYVRRKGYDPEA
jgi:hypothetical protein